jgi:hypothetical protein
MRLGHAEYPVLSFTEALQIAETVKREKIRTVDTLAKHLGHKDATGGAFFDKAAALNKFYGLITQNKQEIELSPLGERAVSTIFGEDARKKAWSEAATRVGLFTQLYAKLGSDFNRKDFPHVLAALTDAAPAELEQKVPRIEKLFLDALKYMAGGPSGIGSDEMNPQDHSDRDPASAKDASGQGTSNPNSPLPKIPPSFKPEDFRQYADGGIFARVPKQTPPEEIEVLLANVKAWLELAKKAQSASAKADQAS